MGSLEMRAQAVIHIDFPSERHLAIVLKALEPEAKSPATSRSRVRVKGEGCRLTLSFEASDTSALRAAVNSYLHWIALIKDTYTVLESFGKE